MQPLPRKRSRLLGKRRVHTHGRTRTPTRPHVTETHTRRSILDTYLLSFLSLSPFLYSLHLSSPRCPRPPDSATLAEGREGPRRRGEARLLLLRWRTRGSLVGTGVRRNWENKVPGTERFVGP